MSAFVKPFDRDLKKSTIRLNKLLGLPVNFTLPSAQYLNASAIDSSIRSSSVGGVFVPVPAYVPSSFNSVYLATMS